MSDVEALVNRFEKDLKSKVTMRSSSSLSVEKVLLEAFKYYDMSKSSTADKSIFLKVMKLRLNISIFSDKELDEIWHFYAGSGSIKYRDFISHLFNTNVQLSTPQEIDERSTKSFTGNKFDVLQAEGLAKKVAEIIVFKLRQKEMASFLKLYREFVVSAGNGGLFPNHLTLAIKKMGIDISSEDISELYNFSRGSRSEIDYHQLIKLLAVNLTDERESALIKMFEKIDFSKTDRVNIGVFKDLFNPKNHFAFRTGRLTLEEVQAQFFSFIDTWAKIPGNNLVVGQESFLFLFSFLSAHTREDKDFFTVIENCFRYTELPRMGSISLKSSDLDNVSVRSASNSDTVLSLVETQLNKKGNKAYISLYKALKFNDFDNDGYVYQKELGKALKEVRIELSEGQLKALFEKFSDSDQKMRFEFLLEKMVPQFSDEKIELIKDLYARLFYGETSNELSFLNIQTCFNSKGHPDVKTGQKDHIEVKSEFLDALQTFLSLMKGSHLSVSLFEFVRFFEFFGKNWEFDYLQSVLLLSFRTRADTAKSVNDRKEEESVRSGKSKVSKREPIESNLSTPYYIQTNEEPAQSVNDFKKKEHKLNTPYYAEENGILSEKPETVKKTNPTSDLYINANKRSFSPENGSITESVGRSVKAISALNEQIRKKDQIETADPELAEMAKQKLIGALKSAKSFAKVLELEYELTTKSDSKGNVDFDVFSVVLENTKVAKTIISEEMKHLFLNSVGRDKKLHVQTFANDLRGQMSENREAEVVRLYERLTSGSREPFLAVDRLRSSLIPIKVAQKFFKTMSSLEVKESWDYLIDLFVCLNLQARKKNDLELDDFLYFVDNFSLYLETEAEFKEFVSAGFK